MANFSWCFIGCIDGLKIVLKTQNLKIKDRNVFVTKKKSNQGSINSGKWPYILNSDYLRNALGPHNLPIISHIICNGWPK